VGFKGRIFAPIDSLQLNLFRIVTGFIFAFQFYKFYGISVQFAQIPFHMTYDLFHWIRPMEGFSAQLFFGIAFMAAIAMALGIFYRAAALITFIGLLYSFLLDKTIYNNHYYLFVLIAGLLLVTDAHRGLSISNPRSTTAIPAWQLWLLQFQVSIVYFYGAVNKMNYDWLVMAEPIYHWLPDMVGEWIEQTDRWKWAALAYGFSYGGLLLDLMAGFLVFIKGKLKYGVMALMVLFSAMNSVLFNIGYFPVFLLGSLLLFVDTPYLRRMLPFARSSGTMGGVRNKGLSVAFLSLYIAFQLLMPLRHYLIHGWYLWDERGMLFSWTMKLRDKEPIISLELRIPATNEKYFVPIEEFLIQRQAKYVAYRPMDLLRFCHFIENHYRKELEIDTDMEVYAEIYVRLNHYRDHQLMINPYVDLTSIDPSVSFETGKQDWIVDLNDDQFGLNPPDPISLPLTRYRDQ
jgi:hypothetical protein